MKILAELYCWNFIIIPVVIICSILIWAKLSIFLSNKYKRIWYCCNVILLVISFGGILRFTIIGRIPSSTHAFSMRTLQMISEQPELIREMVMNTFLYVPFGLFAVYSLPHIVRQRCLICTLAAFVLSVIVELIQYCLGMGLCEPSDVVTNTLGAGIGSLSYILSNWLRKRKEKRKVENT